LTQTKTILLLSAYRCASHAIWADDLINTFKTINWIKLELPGRHFRWRIRGNPLSWLNKLPEQAPDLILATSMVDLATLKGLHPQYANVPCIYYFHENQFAYPVSSQQHASIDPQMVQLYGALAADKCVFNSAFNRDSFLNGINRLLKKLPDEVPENISTQIKQKSEILPVILTGIKRSTNKNPELILWNHRWDYDKAPHVFVDALLKLEKMKVNFKLALLGDRSNKKPDALLNIEAAFKYKIIANGKLTKQEYQKHLSQSTLVISTAIHEFQGLSVLEAVGAGAIPIVPDALCYKEQYPENYRYPAGNSNALAEKMAHFLNEATQPIVPDVSFWSSDELKQKWQSLLS